MGAGRHAGVAFRRGGRRAAIRDGRRMRERVANYVPVVVAVVVIFLSSL
jgi:hypothetical protein